MAEEKSISQKLDSFFDSVTKRLDQDAEERKAHGEALKSLSERLDGYDEEKKADKARKDAEEEKERELARNDADRSRYIDAQVRADKVCQAFGDSAGAPRWQHGESVPDYLRRLMRPFQKHSRDWKDVDLNKISDDAALGVAEERIYADAMQEALHPTDLPLGTMRKIERTDHAGRRIVEFVGADNACWDQFTFHPGVVRAGRINTSIGRRN